MKNPGNAASQLLDLPYAPEAEAYLDELERSGQFRVGPEAEQDDDGAEPAPGGDYAFERGCGHVAIQDWWTHGRVVLRVDRRMCPGDLQVVRLNDSLALRSRDGLDCVTLDGYLGLIPDASTLRVMFADGTEWTGSALVGRITTWLAAVPAVDPPNH